MKIRNINNKNYLNKLLMLLIKNKKIEHLGDIPII